MADRVLFRTIRTIELIGLTVTLLTACSLNPIRGDNSHEDVAYDTKATLVVNRRLYIEANARNTYFQDGYAQRKENVDLLEPFCRFSMNYDTVNESDTTIVEPQRIAVLKVNRARNTAAVSTPVRVAVATTDSLLASEKQLDTWLTRLTLRAPTQAWLTGLDCEVFGSRTRHITLPEIAEMLEPSMSLIIDE